MSHANGSHPDTPRDAARRRALRARRSGAPLPPHLLPRARRGQRGASVALKLAVALAALLVVFGVGTLVLGAISTAAAVSATMVSYREVNASLPNAARIAADTFQTTRILDRNGNVLQEIADQDFGWRTFVDYDRISPYLIDATVAAEDATFWNHPGIEPMAFGRIITINLGGSGSSGGSTITQQLVRALHPETISARDISITRKWREALAAVALEKQYSKHDIITMYVNQIFYGNRSYGVEAAAQTYFHKHAADLTLAEASLLAGIPQQPTNFNPSLYPDEAKQRQDYVLDQMVKLGYITRAEADAAYKEFPHIYPDREGGGAVLDHPHFVQYVHEYLQEMYPDRDFTKGGLNIYTTIDTAVQDRAEQIVAENMTNLGYYNARNAAMTVVFPPTGEILAMVGSADFNNAAIEGMVNITTSPQQPGSAMKPLVYAAAFEQGWNPGTVVLDAPIRMETPGAIDVLTGEPSPYYEPQNYMRNFNGAVTVRKALSNSLNIPAVKAAGFVGGPVAVIDIARRMGIKHALDQPPEDYGLSIALGSGDVWPLELTNAYATFSNMGKYVPVTPILKITDSEGRILYALDRAGTLAKARQVIRPEIAYQITSILTDNEARSAIFGRNNLFGQTQQDLGRPTAAKSGTTNDFRDIWTMGYTSDVAVGVWVGNTRNDPLAEIDGIQGAGPIWQRMIEEMHTNPAFAALITDPATNQPIPGDFPRPAGIIDGVVCDVTGGAPIDEWNGNHRELLVAGGSPANRCDQLSPWQEADLAETLKVMRARGGNFVAGAADSIYRYARAVRFADGSQPVFPQPDPPQLDGK
ncbi:MAG: transglycosylase domain-containing protein [Thermomicrobiales bacterium]|nr:transglycosylase domain-containing protein [Thermomicrobiales bacterium]